ncbi:MAG: hypothetical protein JXB24_00480 [Bacteroidales bacterium]|nr:hypothetical protein [Bacteroidales bacterium]
MKDTLSDFELNLFPSHKIFNTMGYSKDQEGIAKRYISEKKGWDLHLSNTRKFIIECLEENAPKKVSILGSGWLLDIPAEYLMNNCKEVVFYDIRHPRQILHKYRDHSVFRFVKMDLTGGIIDYIYRQREITENELTILEELLAKQRNFLPFNTDFIVSVNILNQLDILIVDYLKLKKKFIDKKSIIQLRSMIQENHVKLLKTGPSCMITDYEEIHFKEEMILQKNSLLYCEIPENMIAKKWVWDFDLNKQYKQGYNTRMNVMAVKFYIV